MKPTGWASPMRHVPSDRGWGACLDRLRARHACTVDGPYCDASGWHVVLTVYPDRAEPLEPQRFAAPTMKELTEMIDRDLVTA